MHLTFWRRFGNIKGLLLLLVPLILRALLWLVGLLWEDAVLKGIHWLYERRGTRWLAVAMTWYRDNGVAGVVLLTAMVMFALWVIAFVDDRILARKATSVERRNPQAARIITEADVPPDLDPVAMYQAE